MKHALIVGSLFFALNGVCRASLISTLDSSAFLGNPGDSVDITGTVSNPGPDTVFLNNISGLLTSPDLSFDFTDFFTVVPAVLNFGDSYMGPIATVLIDPLGQAGDFFGSLTLQGGVDQNTFDDLSTQTFQFTVSASVPEPASALPVAVVIGLLITVRRVTRQRRKRALLARP
jgi:hypothetical protein